MGVALMQPVGAVGKSMEIMNIMDKQVCAQEVFWRDGQAWPYVSYELFLKVVMILSIIGLVTIVTIVVYIIFQAKKLIKYIVTAQDVTEEKKEEEPPIGRQRHEKAKEYEEIPKLHQDDEVVEFGRYRGSSFAELARNRSYREFVESIERPSGPMRWFREYLEERGLIVNKKDVATQIERHERYPEGQLG